MRKAAPFLIILLLGLIAWALKYRSNKADVSLPTTTNNKLDKQPSAKVNRNYGFDRRTSYIEYTEHAKCRMHCRHITQQEVQGIMQHGKINYNKTDAKHKPCPTYALEGITKDDQHVRIVFAQCDEKSKVVTVIDLETKWQCDCPGDDD